MAEVRPDMADPDDRPTLLDVGLRAGEVVRFRSRPSANWQEATVVRRERDGSIGVRDKRGASRALPIDRLEVRAVGARGATRWEALAARARREVQLDLFLDSTGATEARPRSRRRRGPRASR